MSASREASGTKLQYSIQAAKEEHVQAIQSLVRRSGINPTVLDWRNFLVAVDGLGKLIGCGQVKAHADGSCELASIAVEATWRKQGIGSEIIEQLIASNDGELYLMCQSGLGPLYERFDFLRVEQEEIPKYYRRVSQLAGVLDSLRAQGETLFIMRRKPSKAN